MKTAVIYARYSSDTQTEQSIEGQLRVCNEYAKNNDILILRTYIDRAMTGTNDNRPDFRQMIEDSKKHDFSIVLVYKFDRFSRNKYETTKHKKTLKDNGVKVVSATEYIPDSPEAIILESMIEGYAEYYSAELSQKVKRGMNETRQKGNFTGGTIIYGYKVENHKVVIDEEKAEVVRFIYDQYAQGVYVKDIIKTLTERGIFNRGKKFARNTVYNMLKNGSEGNSFDPIVITGSKTSLPHGVPGDKVIQSGDFVTMDFGSIKHGYCSDMTRTVAVGSASEEMRNVYDTVLRAQLAGIAAVRAGVPGREIDAAARKVISDAGYGKYFGHGFGHSLGLDIHEWPNANPSGETPMPAGAVCSAEPGIYIPGRFGVRIEDVMVIREGGAEIITKAPKELVVL